MAGDLSVDLEGMKELRQALKEAEDAMPRELTKALKTAVAPVRDRAAANAMGLPNASGRLAGSLTLFSQARRAGFGSDLPYAGVEEFATTYQRRTPSGGTTQVHLSGAPPRYGYRALDDMGEQVANSIAEAIFEVCRCHGWLEEE
jgi:phage gpG-like protein